MTGEMQSLAQTITICLVCTIYMKYIFIHDMRAHEIASLPFFSLSLSLSHAFTQSLSSLRMCAAHKVSQMKTLVPLMSLISLQSCLFIYLILPINALGSHRAVRRCSEIDYNSLSLEKKKKKKRGSTSFASVRGERAGGKCIFSSHVIIVAR